jgi:hypothetical protein
VKILIGLGILLIIVWVLAWIAFHVTSFLIHTLLVVGLVFIAVAVARTVL